MMLPASTSWPPNFLTPRRRPAVSRPLREEPPAFLCAIADLLHSTGDDAGDLQDRLMLPVALLAPVVVASPLLEDQHLVGSRLLHHFGGDRSTRQHGGAYLGVAPVGDHEHLVEANLGAWLSRHRLDGDEVVLGDAVLLAAGADHCVHARNA